MWNQMEQQQAQVLSLDGWAPAEAERGAFGMGVYRTADSLTTVAGPGYFSTTPVHVQGQNSPDEADRARAPQAFRAYVARLRPGNAEGVPILIYSTDGASDSMQVRRLVMSNAGVITSSRINFVTGAPA